MVNTKVKYSRISEFAANMKGTCCMRSRDHPYITSAYSWPFWTPPTHLTSMNIVLNLSKTGPFADVI